MKHFQYIFKLSILLTGLMIFITSVANATNYYSSGIANPNTLASWWANTNGTGAHPTVWTNAAGIFIVQSGSTYTLNAAWTIAGSVQVLSGGTLSTGAGCISGIRTLTLNAQPAIPAAPTATITQPTCGTATGIITITAPTGAGMTYSTDDVIYTNTTGVFSGIAAGNYNLTAKNSSGSISTITSVTINAQPATPAAPTATVTQPTCTIATGTITITAPTGAGMVYSMDGTTYTNTSGIFSGIAAGNYNVTAKNSSGCISTITSVTINAQPVTPAVPTCSVTNQPTCTAAATITIFPLETGVTYSIDGITYSNTTGIFTNVAPGNYSVTAKNESGCISGKRLLTVNPHPSIPSAPTASVTQPTCTVAGIITISAPAGSGMTYSTDGVTYTNTTGNFSGMAAGNYNLTAKNSSGCISAITPVTVNAQPATPAAPTATVVQPSCATATGTITITAPVGMNYSMDGVTYTNTTGIFSGMAAGDYNLTAKNSSGCISVIKTVTVNAQPQVAKGVLSGSGFICNGASTNLTITITGAGPISGTLSDGTVFSGTAPIITVPVTPVSTATYTISSLTNGTCISMPADKTGSATIIVNTPPSAAISYSGSPFCSNTGYATVTFSGTPGGNYSILPTTASINSTTGEVDLPASNPGKYTITYSVTASGGCSAYSTNAVVIINPNTWTGGFSSDWNTAGNWAGNGVANTCPDVTIQAGVIYKPILNSQTISLQNLIINSGAELVVNNSTLQISGTIKNSGTFNVLNGTIEVNGATAQTIAGSMFYSRTIKNLIVSNTGPGLSVSSTLSDTLKIAGTLSFGNPNSKLYTGDNITLLSNNTATANVGIVGSGNSIIGKVIVEHYINTGTGLGQHGKSWQFLSIPTNGQTVKESLMENGTILPTGYGTQITGPGGIPAGFDLLSQAPSMKYYNYINDSWVGISSTGISAYNQKGYMIFVRGDRSVNGTLVKDPTPTTLRTKGALFTGSMPPISLMVNKYESIGNPYASAIDFSLITKDPGVDDIFYVWDSYLYGSYGVGGYQTISSINDWNPVPGGTKAYNAGVPSKTIQSGQAFFVHTTGIVGFAPQNYTLSFKENCKVVGSSSLSFARSMGDISSAKNQFLSVSLFTGSGQDALIADGNTVVFGSRYSNNVDGDDAHKMLNSGENFGLKRMGKILAIEAKSPIEITDTIYYHMSNLKQQAYQLRFAPKNMAKNGLEAYLADKFLNIMTPVSLTDSSFVNITITSDAASSAADRFKVIFKPIAVLPVSFISIKAYEKSTDIAVEWKVQNEIDMQQYEIEKSVDGNRFTKIATVTAINGGANNYAWLDQHASVGYNYYRIRSISKNGNSNYTQVVKVFIGKAIQEITIFPNPVVNGIINLQFTNQPAGDYGIKLLNSLGQVILSKNIILAEGSSTQKIKWDPNLAKGIYQLEITKPGGEVKVIKMMN